MEVNTLQKKSRRKCPETCKGVIVNADKGRYCKCLEDKMPSSKRNSKTRSVKTRYYADISFLERNENFMLESITLQPPSKEEISTLEAKLLKVGLAPYEIELIQKKFVDGQSLRDIFKEGNWSSVGSLNHHLRSIIKKLRQRGFGL